MQGSFKALVALGALGLATWSAAAAAPAAPQGVITANLFLDIGGGTAVTDLTGNAKFPDSPDSVAYPPYFELYATGDISTPAPSDVYTSSGAQMMGYFYPPTTGDYVFYLSADDGASLYLSTDATPANKKLIAAEAGWSNVRSYTAIGGGSTVEAKSSQTYATTEWPTKDAANGGAKITLTKGQVYYIEALQKEGGGGDNLSVAVQDPSGAIDSSMPIPGQYLSSFGKNSGPVSIVTQPQGATLNLNDPLKLGVVADGTPPYAFQWKRNGGDITDATNSTYSIGRVTSGENNAKFTVVVTGAQGSPVTSAEAVIKVNTDNTPPTIASTVASETFDRITVVFSEPLDTATAENKANYTLPAGTTISSAKLLAPSGSPGDNKVLLLTSKQAEGATLSLTVSNVKDLAGNVIAAGTTAQVKTFVFASGLVVDRFWDNFSANTIDAFTNLTSFPNNPDRVQVETVWEYPANGASEGGSNYGNQLVGWFTAPASGNYVFFTSSDDPSYLYLSTDESAANKKLIAYETGWSDPRQWLAVGSGDVTSKRSDQFASSEWPTPNVITLVANKRYYIESLHTEAGGGDNVSANFIMEGSDDPAGGTISKLQGSVIGVYLDPTGTAISITQQPAATTAAEGSTVTFTVAASFTSPYASAPSYQWYRDGNPITGATAASYTTPELNLTADQGAKFKCVASVPLASATSAEVALTVTKDTAAPKIAKVKASSVATLIVTFDEPVDATTAIAANFALSGGATVATAAPSGNGVLLTTSSLTSGGSYTLTVGGVKDRYGNVMAAGTTFSFSVNVITYADVILADGPVMFYRFEETTGQKTKNFGTAGTGADGLWMTGAGPDDSSPADVHAGTGPRPGEFLGFAPDNRSGTFTGQQDQLWVDAQQQLLNNLPAFSLEYWVKPSNRVSDPTAFGTRIGIVGQNDAVEYGFISPTTIQIWTPGGGSLDTTYSFPDNTWHHVATIADGKSIKNYFDGVFVNQTTATSANYGSSTYNVHVGGGGAFDATGNHFTGEIDEVAIFNKAISADRIAAHFKAGKEGGESPVTAAIKTIKLQGGNVVITFDGILQSAASVTGPWTDVAGAPAGGDQSYSTASSAAQQYFRSKGQ